MTSEQMLPVQAEKGIQTYNMGFKTSPCLDAPPWSLDNTQEYFICLWLTCLIHVIIFLSDDSNSEDDQYPVVGSDDSDEDANRDLEDPESDGCDSDMDSGSGDDDPDRDSGSDMESTRVTDSGRKGILKDRASMSKKLKSKEGTDTKKKMVHYTDDIEISGKAKKKMPITKSQLAKEGMSASEEESGSDGNDNSNADLEMDTDSETSDQQDKDLDKEKYTEDIYGRLRDSKGNIVKQTVAQSGAYVPPGKRAELAKGVDQKKKLQLERMKKQLKGLVNR